MAVYQISTREFRERQASVLDMADRGENIIIRRGSKAYALTPITADDLYFTPEIMAKIDRSIEQARQGRVHRFGSAEELDRYLDSL